MATDLTNPAASGGLDFGAILDKTLGAYQAISVARISNDTAKYNAAATTQYAALHNSESPTGLDAWVSSLQGGGTTNKTVSQVGGGINPLVVYGVVGVIGAAILWKVFK